jgi:lysophospholipase L1-like esterase
VAFAAIAVVLLLGLVEGGLRLIGVQPYLVDLDIAARLATLHQLVDGDPVVYTLKPDSVAEFSTQLGSVHYRINGVGLRGPEITRQKPPQVCRVLLLGDSVTFGFGVSYEQTFAAQLQARLSPQGACGTGFQPVEPGLQARATPRVEVLNAAAGGYNTYNERVFYETRGHLFQPDLVLLMVCPNDVDNPLFHFEYNSAARFSTLPNEAIPNVPEFQRVLAQRKERPAGRPSFLRQVARVSIRYSAFAHLVGSSAHPDPHSGHQWEACVWALGREDSMELAWFSKQVIALNQAVNSDHAALGVVLVPLSWQLADETDLSLPGRANLASLCRKNGIAFLDTSEFLKRAAPARELFFDACHLAPKGHTAVADAILEWVGTQEDMWIDD